MDRGLLLSCLLWVGVVVGCEGSGSLAPDGGGTTPDGGATVQDATTVPDDAERDGAAGTNDAGPPRFARGIWNVVPLGVMTPGEPAVAMNGQGDGVIVVPGLISERGGSGMTAFRVTPSGALATTSEIAGRGGEPSVVMDASGNAIVGWINGGVFAARAAAGSSTWSQPSAVAVRDQWSGRTPTILRLVGNGGGVVAALITNSVNDGLRMTTNYFAPGSGWESETDLSGPLSQFSRASAVVAPNGEVHAAWECPPTTFGERRRVCVSSRAAGRWTASTAWHGRLPTVVMAAGAPYVVFDDYGTDDYEEDAIVGRSPSGSGLAMAEISGPDFAVGPVAAGDGQSIDVVWLEFSLRRLMARRYVPGSGWEAPQVLGPFDPNQLQDYAVASGSSGDALVVWRQNSAIWVKRRPAGGSWLSTDRIANVGPLESIALPRIAVGGGGAIIVWQATDSISGEVRAMAAILR